MSGTAWWLCDAAGMRRRIRAGGVLIGRSTDCDIVLVEPEISRHHAVVYLEEDTPHLVPLGSAPPLLGGKVVEGPTPLSVSDAVTIGPVTLRVDATPLPREGPRFLLQLIGGGAYSVAGRRFTIGGGAEDDLHVPSLVAGAITLTPHAGFLSVELSCPGVRSGGHELVPGELGSLRVGSTLKFGEVTLRVTAGDESSSASTREAFGAGDGPLAVSLTFLPRGGRLRVIWDDRESEVYLAERRCNLMGALLQPAAPAKAGDFVEDDHLLPRVWPGETKTRTHLNTLIHRTRKDMVLAGVDGPALLQRAEGGGATRLAVSKACIVSVE